MSMQTTRKGTPGYLPEALLELVDDDMMPALRRAWDQGTHWVMIMEIRAMIKREVSPEQLQTNIAYQKTLGWGQLCTRWDREKEVEMKAEVAGEAMPLSGPVCFPSDHASAQETYPPGDARWQVWQKIEAMAPSMMMTDGWTFDSEPTKAYRRWLTACGIVSSKPDVHLQSGCRLPPCVFREMLRIRASEYRAAMEEVSGYLPNGGRR